jgi:hypothetical protein
MERSQLQKFNGHEHLGMCSAVATDSYMAASTHSLRSTYAMHITWLKHAAFCYLLQ